MSRFAEKRRFPVKSILVAALFGASLLACTVGGVSDPVGLSGVYSCPMPPEGGRSLAGDVVGKWKYVRMESSGSDANSGGTVTYSQVLTLSEDGTFRSSDTWMYGETGNWFTINDRLYFEPHVEQDPPQPQEYYGNPYQTSGDTMVWGSLTLTREY